MNDDNISRVARASSVASEVGVGGRRKILTKKKLCKLRKDSSMEWQQKMGGDKAITKILNF